MGFIFINLPEVRLLESWLQRQAIALSLGSEMDSAVDGQKASRVEDREGPALNMSS